MRKLFLLTLTLFLFCICRAQEIDQEIRARVLEPTVMLRAVSEEGSSGGIGTGVVFAARGKCYVLTAGHVVDSLRHVEEDVDEAQGRDVKRIRWEDAAIVQILYENDKKVGQLVLDAKVVAFAKSDEEGGQDLALLEIYKKDFVRDGARFIPADKRVYVTQPCYHVGSLHGEFAGSVSSGIMAAIGRKFRGNTFNQTDTAIAPGSSGGGLFVQFDGKMYYSGMVTRGGQSVGLAIPADRIRAWLVKEKFGFVIGDDGKDIQPESVKSPVPKPNAKVTSDEPEGKK